MIASIRSSRFLIEIEGLTQIAFAEVFVPNVTIELIEVRVPPYHTVQKTPGQIRYSNLILRWGLTQSMELLQLV
jgi:hypothetical protein